MSRHAVLATPCARLHAVPPTSAAPLRLERASNPLHRSPWAKSDTAEQNYARIGLQNDPNQDVGRRTQQGAAAPAAEAASEEEEEMDDGELDRPCPSPCRQGGDGGAPPQRT